MTMAIDNWVRIKNQLKQIDVEVNKWYNNELNLSYSQQQQLFDKRHRLARLLVDNCPHDKSVVCRGSFNNKDKHDIMCRRCNRVVENNSNDQYRATITKEMSLNEAIALASQYNAVEYQYA